MAVRPLGRVIGVQLVAAGERETGRGGGEIRALTGLRGVAALLVAAYHVTFLGVRAPWGAAPLIRHGYLGVDLFFALSGFVMALTYGELAAARPFPFRVFLAKRLRRIYPLYGACVLVVFLCVDAGLLPRGPAAAESAGRLVVDLALLQCLGAGPSLLAVSWSLSTEWIAYLLFPLLARLALHRGRTAWVVLGAAALLTLLALCHVPTGAPHGFDPRALLHQPLDHTDTSTPYPLLRGLAGFSLGLLAWRAAGAGRAVRSGLATDAAALTCVAVLGTRWADYLAVPCVCALLMCLGARARPGLVERALASRPAHWLGRLSYAFYLVHLPLWLALHPWTDRAGWPPLLLLAPALLLAWVCHLFIELPGRRVLSRVFGLASG